jgi:uncharacterized protein GlcG (DUF336 family)
MSLKPSEAEKVVEAGLIKAREVDARPVTVVVVDAAGELAAVGREEAAGGHNFDLAFAGAYTTALFGRTGDELEALSQRDFYLGLVGARGGQIAVFKGMVPIKRGDEVIGGVAASGATAEHDLVISEAGAAVVS